MSQLTWQKSTYSEAGGDNCINVAAANGAVHLRESDDAEVVLTTTPHALAALLRAARSIA